ncbi:hypothetical protein ACFIQF_13765 [Comamonas sp. J-3]|jgi:hypothetical protein|uniref:hypothetical protein n=1 Tax=Comamonas trifloxystrobinivorans TaxID=3350256 RepID=UPI003727651C
MPARVAWLPQQWLPGWCGYCGNTACSVSSLRKPNWHHGQASAIASRQWVLLSFFQNWLTKQACQHCDGKNGQPDGKQEQLPKGNSSAMFVIASDQ